MDLKQIKQVIDLMKRSDLTEFAVEEEGFKLSIKRAPDGSQIVEGFRGALQNQQTSGPAPAALASSPPLVAVEEVGVTYIKSPMVGTFYRAASPESPPFVDNGTKIDEKAVVCIIEAMKIMNEIQAEVKGTVIEMLVENGQPVEYGQRIFKVKTS